LFVLAWELLALLSEQEKEEEAKEEEATSLLLLVVQLVSAWVPGQFVSLLVLALFREPLASLEAEKKEAKEVEVPSLALVPEPSALPIVQVLPPEHLSSLSALSA
jgi:hypothetical protein